ncbi:flagellar hook protein FlgE [Sphingomonas glaciei]|uniref:Flagellar hook protein FlgE n=1 Tax=Sphingomonas glaciei TaxID=2938948 RepID=A0ABY5MQX1_9SPHN|nr:flagellar hook protein FlgE [Sphingomonas glaciei]UUR06894.1 flagellar hook protein FlgE [Sphingomonas glaciei]
MSLYSALYAGVSGLGAQSSAMAGVADNITNINTIGYKGVSTEFRTLVTSGGLSSSYSAGGVAAAPQALISKQGLIQASSSQTDLAIDGAGFFVVRTGTGADSDVAFTRAGAFKPDVQGFLRNTSGYYLQGWRLDAAGNFTDTGLDSLQAVRVSDLTGSASPTSQLRLRANLQSDAAVLAGPYTAGDLATGTVTPQFQRSFDIYDAQGSAHRISMGFVKTAPNEWQAEIFAVPATDVTATDGLLASGTVKFNPDGSLDLAGSSAALFADLTPTWTNGAGAQPIDLQLGTDGKLDGLIQFSGPSAIISSSVDGGVLGNLASIEVDETGVVSAIFDDGTSRKVFQLPVATFLNPDGLTRLNGNAFALSSASGAVAINPPGALGSGMISSSSLEGSNVDLASEFTSMIRFQRAYSASSKIITTVDDMLQELSNLKR